MPTASLTWLGHSTVVVELDGGRIVTDPLLTRRVAHLWRSGPTPQLGAPVDVVALSHVHWDHLHLPSLRRIAPGATVIVVPHGAESLVQRFGFTRVVAVRAGDVVRIGEVDLQVTHAEHPPMRRGRTRSGAVGYVFRGRRAVYFAGDTDLFDGMRELARDLDVALVPISGWGPTLSAGHLDPHTAVKALELLQPRVAVPIHWGTFAPLGLAMLGGSRTAAEDFRDEAVRRVPDVDVQLLQVGATLSF
jgi:L-ascorbate metabolism protein UlaG (beta-lactamase superfamily)